MISIANVGTADKIIRLIAGVALIAASFLLFGGFSTSAGVASMIIGAVLVVTGLINFCPAYKILGIGTR